MARFTLIKEREELSVSDAGEGIFWMFGEF